LWCLWCLWNFCQGHSRSESRSPRQSAAAAFRVASLSSSESPASEAGLELDVPHGNERKGVVVGVGGRGVNRLSELFPGV
jgi:hypothetical protein